MHNGHPVAIRVDGLSRWYGQTQALADVGLMFGRGITGLLGPNGAGKTTLLTVLATAAEPDAGTVSIFGLDPADRAERTAIRRRLGYLPQELRYHRHFTVTGFLDYVAILKEITDRRRRAQEVARVLAATGLERLAGRRVRALSGGMRQRLGIAQALLGGPDLLILDEPTAGLDPEQRLRFAALGGGQGFASVAIVRHAPITLWTEPVADYTLAPAAPQLTAAGFLLAKAMADLPRGKVESILRAAWPAWLNWHTTDARLAAALGIPMPAVATPPGAGLAPPGAPQPPPSPPCT